MREYYEKWARRFPRSACLGAVLGAAALVLVVGPGQVIERGRHTANDALRCASRGLDQWRLRSMAHEVEADRLAIEHAGTRRAALEAEVARVAAICERLESHGAAQHQQLSPLQRLLDAQVGPTVFVAGQEYLRDDVEDRLLELRQRAAAAASELETATSLREKLSNDLGSIDHQLDVARAQLVVREHALAVRWATLRSDAHRDGVGHDLQRVEPRRHAMNSPN